MDQEPRSLDEIMSREPIATHEEVLTPTPAAPETDTQGQSRDEHGKFAPKQETAGTNTDPDKTAQGVVEGGDGKGKVPLQAVHAEREKRQQAQTEAETLRRELAELRGQVSMLRQPAQAQPTEPPKPKKTFWEDPDGFLAERLAPVQQTMQDQRIELSTMLAAKDHGADTVKEARAALLEAMQANPNDPSLIALDQQSQRSVHPMEDVITWHNRRKAMADIGEDPAAYRERVRQELLAELQPTPTNQQQPAAPKPVMPSNFATARSEGPRTGVVFDGPKPLSEITKGSAQ